MNPEVTITIYEAIAQMRTLTAKGKSFSLVHATFDRSTNSTDGIRRVNHAHLRPSAKKDDLINADFKLFYYDEDMEAPRVTWQPLILFFNDKRCVF